jgi:hypothetical protein
VGPYVNGQHIFLGFIAANAAIALIAGRHESTWVERYIFLKSFCSSWPKSGTGSTSLRCTTTNVAEEGPKAGGDVRMQLHLKYFCVGDSPKDARQADGILCHRLVASVKGAADSLPTWIIEKRTSVNIRCPFPSPSSSDLDERGGYTLVRLSDDVTSSGLLTEFDFPWDIPELKICKGWTGISMFQRLIHKELGQWAKEWRYVLRAVERVVDFQVCVDRGSLVTTRS